MNDYRYYTRSSYDYLSHHGILGQKWGKQNGPPYPLDAKVSTGSKLKKIGASIKANGVKKKRKKALEKARKAKVKANRQAKKSEELQRKIDIQNKKIELQQRKQDLKALKKNKRQKNVNTPENRNRGESAVKEILSSALKTSTKTVATGAFTYMGKALVAKMISDNISAERKRAMKEVFPDKKK